MIMPSSMIILVLGVLILFFTIAWYGGVAMTIFVLMALLISLYLRRRALTVWQKETWRRSWRPAKKCSGSGMAILETSNPYQALR
jgi:hypothetical protein